MLNFKRPMLACSLLPPNIEHTDENILAAMQKLKYPVLATLKKDGIRAIKLNDLVSRTLKLIPNRSIRARAIKLPAGFDMELWNPALAYDEVESIVMSREHKDSDLIQFHILDWFGKEGGYIERWKAVFKVVFDITWPIKIPGTSIVVSEPQRLDIEQRAFIEGDSYFPKRALNAQQLLDYFLRIENENGEGICFRLPNSPYKQGRSTLKEQYLIKLARYIRQEVTIIGFYEQMENGNPERRNAVGKMDRSKSLGDMIGKNTLGGFHVKSKDGIEFDVGTGVGLTDVLRKSIWENRVMWIGKQIVVKHKPHGAKIKPRSPIYVGLRQEGF